MPATPVPPDTRSASRSDTDTVRSDRRSDITVSDAFVDGRPPVTRPPSGHRSDTDTDTGAVLSSDRRSDTSDRARSDRTPDTRSDSLSDRAPAGGRIRRATAAAVGLFVGVLALVTVVGWAVSFAALADLAERSGAVPVGWGLTLPLVVDGVTLAGMVGAVVRAGTGRRTWPAWLVVVAGSAASVLGNVLHAPAEPVARTIAAAFPVAILVGLEMLRAEVRALALLPSGAGVQPRPGPSDGVSDARWDDGSGSSVSDRITRQATGALPGRVVADGTAVDRMPGETLDRQSAGRAAVMSGALSDRVSDDGAVSVSDGLSDRPTVGPSRGAGRVRQASAGRRQTAPGAAATALARAYGSGLDPATGTPWRGRALARAAGTHHDTASRWLRDRPRPTAPSDGAALSDGAPLPVPPAATAVRTGLDDRSRGEVAGRD